LLGFPHFRDRRILPPALTPTLAVVAFDIVDADSAAAALFAAARDWGRFWAVEAVEADVVDDDFDVPPLGAVVLTYRDLVAVVAEAVVADFGPGVWEEWELGLLLG